MANDTHTHTHLAKANKQPAQNEEDEKKKEYKSDNNITNENCTNEQERRLMRCQKIIESNTHMNKDDCETGRKKISTKRN